MNEAELACWLRPLFERERVDPSYLRFVIQHLRVPDESWRTCCYSSCDPCVERLGNLVDAARRHLGFADDEPEEG